METKRKPFSDEELQFMRENSTKMTAVEIAAALGRPYVSVSHKLRDMGLPRKYARWRKTDKWTGCNETCPDFCPYDDCMMPGRYAAIGYKRDFEELFDNERQDDD